jgi:murein DD-endopeptidase MepM/ murein hydrolase activator NlpD
MPSHPRRSVLALCLATTLAAVVSPMWLGVASARPAAGPLEPRAGPPIVRFDWPLAPPHPVVRPFEAPASPYGPGHRGVDLGGPAGAPVLAAGAGVVVFAGPVAGRGVVSVDHPNGLRTTYEPVAPAVRAGRRVSAGAVLGRLRLGHAGCPGACLHWGVRRGEEYLDPLSLMGTGHVRLLPWEDDAYSNHS